MARGSIRWRCYVCRKNDADRFCDHPGAAYSIVYRVGDKQRWKAVGQNKKEAEHRLAEVLNRVHAGTYRELKPIKFSEFADQWLHNYAEGTLKPSTLRRYRGLIAQHLRRVFGDFLLTEITPETVQGYISKLLRENRLARRTVNHSVVLLKVMLKHAQQWEYLRDNPTQHIKLLRIESKEMDFLRPDEIRLLLSYFDEPYRTFVLTAIFTGLRMGELLGLQWGDVDFYNNVIHVRRSLFWHTRKEIAELNGSNGSQKVLWRFITPKSNRSRTIKMSPKLKEVLELYRIKCPESPHDLVFCSKRGNPIHPWNIINREFKPALKQAGLREIRFHDLRHTFTALLIAKGENVLSIQRQLGHASIQTTLDKYGHLLPENQQDGGKFVDDLVFGSADAHANTMLTKHPETAQNIAHQRQVQLDTTPTKTA